MIETDARILIGVPAFAGAAHIGETLRSIAAQTCRDFRVLISVDGGDRDTAAACAPFLDEPRVVRVMQEERLGWDGNINWLMAQARGAFFCYWQQDDVVTPDYLAALLAAADANPAAVCLYSDLQWTEGETALAVCPSVTGFARDRALAVLESMNGVPFRGLIRTAAIARTGPIRRTPFESAHEEFVWLAKLAREGDLLRVPGPLYYKRKHAGSVSTRWHRREPAWKRAVWIEYGLGMLETLWPLVAEAEREVALGVVLDRLCRPREGRFLFYDPAAEPVAFAAAVVAQACTRFALPAVAAAIASGDTAPRFAGGCGGDLLDRAVQRLAASAAVRRMLEDTGTVELGFAAGAAAGRALLEHGWAAPDAAGAPMQGRSAALTLPLPETGSWRVVFAGLPSGARRRGTVSIAIDAGAPAALEWDIAGRVESRVEAVVDGRGDAAVRFTVPETVAAWPLGLRREPAAGITLDRITISRA
ncbi:glycosyltransferase family 2 protein [Rhodoplanes sp. TEM]|uniref:Glycosyltransferase family 2 protein n=1 Tax=Rhodoplanes tepidamans TaxID=200616 RepID=A0ABT5JKZ7_RHOTP|nr:MULTISPECIES: glycosyltransferase family 2 protein [Rhodoplanes]MDC7789921.1 glycosyltransferase family 2 protein [Rhodoplanes tepidamans]MDC7988090.1 glycosyltransferase family 2 protein [Rhodoplanes sp. TEM]MDQ0358928.1 GT2 family glycosyltransferase [Rhodoplanes tepidamans]